MKQPIYLAASKGFIVAASVFYLNVVLALLLAALPWWLRLCVCSLLLLDYRRVISLYGLRTHKKAIQLLLHDCDQWRYQLGSGQECLGDCIKSRSFCSSLILVLYIQHGHTARYIVIPRDAVSTRAFRYLAYKIIVNRDIINIRSD